jgi:hypothetical protein
MKARGRCREARQVNHSAEGAKYESHGSVERRARSITAPKVRNMKARGKREARRPWLNPTKLG